jgi:hypothetical protein
MFIEPASKVSVPFTVVMRTRSKVPLRAGDEPLDINIAEVDVLSDSVPVPHHVFDPIKVSVTAPL